jgi:hypothetical protein
MAPAGGLPMPASVDGNASPVSTATKAGLWTFTTGAV